MSTIGDMIDPPRRASFIERGRRQGKTLEALRAELENIEEAFTLLGLISAEFQSDPSSVACFDLRIVERVKRCVESRTTAIERGDGLSRGQK